ncbi:uncharacterized protein [Montipora capricornis]|uniref:uncharacterized protein n=1 Tax=Montipora capricornis TaxID=246305 RepID=UPI0035F13204
MYVDDCLSGADDVEATVKLQQSLDKMMERGGFNLTKWASNSREVLSHIAEQEQAEASTLDLNASEPLKALGICWNILTDCFLFNVSPSMLTVSDPETKRSLLSIGSRVVDPMGLITPFTIRAKMLFQELWQRGSQWEDRLDEDIADQWRSWKSELSQLSCITTPRYFMGNIESSSSIELHGFGDASPAAYGAAVYIKCLGEAGQASTHLVMSKSRVAPAKTVSLPRLELLAVVVNARLLKFVAESLMLKVDRVVCWTDSMVTLQWIRGSSSQWKTFVVNRVAEIQSTWDPQHWKHCSGEDNPADLLTRGLPAKVLADSKLWWGGPCWLSSQCLPDQRELLNELTESVEKERKHKTDKSLCGD